MKNLTAARTKDFLKRSVEHGGIISLLLKDLRRVSNTVYNGWPSKERTEFSLVLVRLDIVVSRESRQRPVTEPVHDHDTAPPIEHRIEQEISAYDRKSHCAYSLKYTE